MSILQLHSPVLRLPFARRPKPPLVNRLAVREASSQIVKTPEAVIDQKLKQMAVALGLSIGGVIYPSLALAGGALVLVVMAPAWKEAYTAVVQERKVTLGAVDGTIAAIALGTGHIFAATLGGFLFLLSRKLVLKTEDHTRQSMVNLFGQQIQQVTLLEDGVEQMRPIEHVRHGDRVVVNAGEMIPVDGRIVAGVAGIDQHVLTGEAQMVEREQGDSVFAATMVLSGRIIITAEKTGAETTAAQVAKTLLTMADYKTSIQTRGEVIADQAALPTLLAGGFGLLSGLSLINTAALMNANFGYNMRILAPITMLNYLKLIAERGVLVKDGRALELLRTVDTVVFDKTGTLTEEQPQIGAIHSVAEYSAAQLLQLAASAEYKQTHPIARAILQAAADQLIDLLPIDHASYTVGFGLTVRSGALQIQIGSARFMQTLNLPLPETIAEAERRCKQAGHALVMVAVDGAVVGAIELHTTVRAETQTIIAQLRRQGIASIAIISGDQEEPTRRLAHWLGVDQYFANVLPENKAHHIQALQEQGKKVCYVGDGINDVIALKQANVSISLSGAATIATDTAAIILMDGSLRQLPYLLHVAQQFENNLQRSIALTVLPGFLCMGGVLFLHFSIVTTIVYNQLILAAGMINALRPPKERSAD